jgi:DNA-binding SARP family transcriptional activator/predicted ATPase
MTNLNIRLLGEFSLTYAGEPVHSIGSMRLQSILAYLLLHRRSPESRRHLAFTLWPDSTERQARTNLRRELHNLRQRLPGADEYLSSGTQTLQWRVSASYTLDVADFEEALAIAAQLKASSNEPGARDALIKAVTVYQGDLLPGFYDEWLLTERDRLRQEFLSALDQIIELLQKQNDYRTAIGYAHQLLREEPLREDAYLHLIRLYAATGDRARALRMYHTCTTTLLNELGVQPAPATRLAYEQLLITNEPHQQVSLPPQNALVYSPPLVGRQKEQQLLQACWQKAASGQPQVVAVTGEAGIGKTRLVEELVEWAARKGITTAQARCYTTTGGLAYAPVADWLRASGLRDELMHLDDIWLGLVARLLPEILLERSELPAPELFTESWQRQRFFEALARSISINTKPKLLVIDDLQWTDQESLAWLHFLLRYQLQAPFLVAATIRSTEIDYKHPITATLATHLSEDAIDPDMAAQLFSETEGNPLFIVEIVRSGERKDPLRTGPSSSLKIQAVIEYRLAQLSPSARRLANLAAVIGRAFAYDVLAAASNEDEDRLVSGLDELWRRRIIREQSENDYDFSHNRIREIAYNNLSAANRRLLHRRVAEAIKTVRRDNLDPYCQQIALHFEAAREIESAVTFYQRAGQVAQQVYATQDAIQLYEHGLVLLETLPENHVRAQQELILQRLLSIVHRNSKGYAATEVMLALSRARDLCQQLHQTEDLGPILWGLFSYHYVRSDLRQARNLGEELFVLAQEKQNSAYQLQAHHALGGTLFSLGEFEGSQQHFEQGIALYDSNQHHAQIAMFGVDLGVFCLAWSAHSLWHLGYLDQAINRSYAAIALANKLMHPFSQALAMAYAAMVFQFSCNDKLVEEWARATRIFCEEHNIGYYDRWAAILEGWALAEQGASATGIKQIQSGLANFRSSNAEARLSYYLALLANAYGQAGQVTESHQLLDEALAVADKNSDHWYCAEIYRLMGNLSLQSLEDEKAENYYQMGLQVSRRQKSRIFELRVSISLARFWSNQSRAEEARGLLLGILPWFSEGLASNDLILANNLLAEISRKVNST